MLVTSSLGDKHTVACSKWSPGGLPGKGKYYGSLTYAWETCLIGVRQYWQISTVMLHLYRRRHGTAEGMVQKRACYSRGHGIEEGMVQKRAWYSKGMVQQRAWYKRGHGTEEGMVQKRAWYSRGHGTAEEMVQEGKVPKRAWYSRGHGTEEGMVQKRAWYSRGRGTEEGLQSDNLLSLQMHMYTIFVG